MLGETGKNCERYATLAEILIFGCLVSLKVNETVNKIVCNANELEIQSAEIRTVYMKTENTYVFHVIHDIYDVMTDGFGNFRKVKKRQILVMIRKLRLSRLNSPTRSRLEQPLHCMLNIRVFITIRWPGFTGRLILIRMGRKSELG